MRTGGCRCRKVRFEIGGEPLGGIACHCRDCQYAAGGSPNLTWIFQADSLRVEGDPRCFKASEKSGGSWFCGECGTQIFSTPDSNPHLVAIKVGALDDAAGFVVQADIWMASAPGWHHAHAGAAQFDQNMEPTPNTTP